MPKVSSSVTSSGARTTKLMIARLRRVTDDKEDRRREGQDKKRIEARRVPDEEGDECAEHDEDAVREIDDIQDAPDDGEAERDEHIDAADQDAIDDLLRPERRVQKKIHRNLTPGPSADHVERGDSIANPWRMPQRPCFPELLALLHRRWRGAGGEVQRLSQAGVGYLTSPLAASFGQTVTFLPP